MPAENGDSTRHESDGPVLRSNIVHDATAIADNFVLLLHSIVFGDSMWQVIVLTHLGHDLKYLSRIIRILLALSYLRN